MSTLARRKMRQQALKPRDIEAVLEFARLEYRDGVRFHFLGRRDLPRGRERELGHLVGTVVISGSGASIVTVYRNPRALGRIKRKPKRRRP